MSFLLAVPSQAPPNFRASQVSDTSIDLAWQHPELSSTMWEIFQGYKIFVRPAGSSGVHSITINAQKTVARLQGLKSLVTYDISIAAYTFAGVGKESEIICITTTLGKTVNNSKSYHPVLWLILADICLFFNFLMAFIQTRQNVLQLKLQDWLSRKSCTKKLLDDSFVLHINQ